MILQQFHRFTDLPRELQLLIWEIHEADNLPHFTHYFRRMVVYSGRLYAAADESSGRLAYTSALPDGPTETEVPDQAITPNSKIRLLGIIHWLSDEHTPNAANFSAIQSPRPAPSDSHAWVNFSHDTFCFANADSARFDGGFLDYFREDNDIIMSSLPSSGRLDRTQWFFCIQNLALVVLDGQLQLAAFDRLLLANHSSLKSVTLITNAYRFVCSQFDHDMGLAFQPGIKAERIPLDEFVAILDAAGSCDCVTVTQRVNELRALGQELVDLLGQNQPQDAGQLCSRVPTVRIEVEIFCDGRPDIQQVIAARARREQEVALEGTLFDNGPDSGIPGLAGHFGEVLDEAV